MANEEHLKILRQGVEVWNRWRKDNPKINPNLSKVDLSWTNLDEADLSQANLRGANLSYTDMSEANFSYADLRGANLKGANLSYTDLGSVANKVINLGEENLNYTLLRGADLRGANLSKANLSKANLRRVNLKGAILGGTNLKEANLSRVNLRGTNLKGANFCEANLSYTDLRGKDLSKVNLSQAILQKVNLQKARLINTKLDGANLTGARLWETQRAGWSIKRVICESVYWDREAIKRSEYAPGEFERLFAEKPLIRLFYKDGINPLEIATLPALIQHLSDSHPGCNLRFVSIHEDSGGAVVELAIEETDNLPTEQVKQLQSTLTTKAQQLVEARRLALTERETRLQLEGEVKQLNSMVDKLLDRTGIKIKNKGKISMSEDKGDKYINKGQVGAMGDNTHAHHMTFNQTVNNTSESLDLVALATELPQLRMAIKNKQDTSPQADIALGEIAKAEIAAGEKDESGVWKHMKVAGKYALDTATTIGTTLAAEVLKKAMGM